MYEAQRDFDMFDETGYDFSKLCMNDPPAVRPRRDSKFSDVSTVSGQRNMGHLLANQHNGGPLGRRHSAIPAYFETPRCDSPAVRRKSDTGYLSTIRGPTSQHNRMTCDGSMTSTMVDSTSYGPSVVEPKPVNLAHGPSIYGELSEVERSWGQGLQRERHRAHSTGGSPNSHSRSKSYDFSAALMGVVSHGREWTHAGDRQPLLRPPTEYTSPNSPYFRVYDTAPNAEVGNNWHPLSPRYRTDNELQRGIAGESDIFDKGFNASVDTRALGKPALRYLDLNAFSDINPPSLSGRFTESLDLNPWTSESISHSTLIRDSHGALLRRHPPPQASHSRSRSWSDAASRFMQREPVSTGDRQRANTQADMRRKEVYDIIAQRGLNPTLANFGHRPNNAKYFVIKSNTAANVHASLEFSVWSSTELGNKRLNNAFNALHDVYLFFSVNGSGRFCGVARMTSGVDWNRNVDVWEQAKRWKGAFDLDWVFVKDIPNQVVKHLRVPANENKPVSNSRDTQELPEDVGQEMLRIFAEYISRNCILEDMVDSQVRQV